MEFLGFEKAGVDFLFENRLHDNRLWYNEHKQIYHKSIVAPATALIEELAPTMLQIDSKLIVDPKRLISRINRDIRFSRDKTLYRDNMWFAFVRDKKRMAVEPCFWFEINQQGISYGTGYFKAERQSMESIRQLILHKDPVAVQAIETFAKQRRYALEGEMYKRSKYPDASPVEKQWLDRKNIAVYRDISGYDLAFSPALPAALKKAYRELTPYYQLWRKAESLVVKEDEPKR